MRGTKLLLVIGVMIIGIGGLLNNIYRADTGTTLYISPNGSDNSNGSATSPFKTLEHARKFIRDNNLKGATVFLRGGVYEQKELVYFDGGDSGTSQNPITYKPYPGETPVIRGSMTLPNFTNYSGNIVVSDLTSLGITSVSDLYLNGQIQVTARTPNFIQPDFSKSDPYAGNYLYTTSDSDRTNVYFDKTKIDTRSWTNVGAGRVVVYPGPNITNNIINISAIDQASAKITLTSETGYSITKNNRFFIENLPQLLDAPNEWYFDTTTKKLYYYPPKTLTTSDRVSIPTTKTLIRFEGAKYIDFQGITFEENLENTINIGNSKYINISGCTVRDSGGLAVSIYASSDNITVDNNIISDTNSGGIQVWQDESYIKILAASGINIKNNSITRTGRRDNSTSGISIYGVGIDVANNEVYDTPRIGISYRGNNNIIESNYVHDVNRLTEDGGGIYTLGRSYLYRGNIIKDNLVKDTGGYAQSGSSWVFNSFTWGIYLDDFSSGNTVTGNTVVRTPRGIQIHGGRDNIISQNIISEAGEYGQVWFQGIDLSKTVYDEAMLTQLNDLSSNGYDRNKYFRSYPELGSIKKLTNETAMSGNKFTKNIISFPAHSDVDLYFVNFLVQSAGNEINDNIIWNGGDTTKLKIFDPQGDSLGGKNSRFTYGQWQAFGFDTRSQLVNPGFTNPANDNFTPTAGSPAEKLGYKAKQINTGATQKQVSNSNSDSQGQNILSKTDDELVLEKNDQTNNPNWLERIAAFFRRITHPLTGAIDKIL